MRDIAREGDVLRHPFLPRKRLEPMSQRPVADDEEPHVGTFREALAKTADENIDAVPTLQRANEADDERSGEVMPRLYPFDVGGSARKAPNIRSVEHEDELVGRNCAVAQIVAQMTRDDDDSVRRRRVVPLDSG